MVQWQDAGNDALWYFCGVGKTLAYAPFCANKCPCRVVKVDAFWSDEFLECPPATEPLARAKSRVVIRAEVGEKDDADLGFTVPFKHGVDGLGELGTARLVDTTSVDPDVFQPEAHCGFAGPHDLDEALLALSRAWDSHLLEGHFAILPGVRENVIWWDVWLKELDQSER